MFMIKYTFAGKVNKHFVTFEYKIVILKAYGHRQYN